MIAQRKAVVEYFKLGYILCFQFRTIIFYSICVEQIFQKQPLSYDQSLCDYYYKPSNKISHIKLQMQLVSRLQHWLPRKKLDIFGKDSLLKTSLPYYILSILPAMGLFVQQPNPYVFIAITYSGFPILDQIFSFDTRNPNNKERVELEKDDPYFRLTLYSAVLVSWAIFFKTMRIFSAIQVNIDTIPFLIGFIFIVSNFYASQFSVSHELMHKPGRFYRILGTVHMIKHYYMHFTYHHLYRHHYQVATPSDPSSSKKGENVYSFIVRCIILSWKGVYDDQKKLGKPIYANYAILSIVGSMAFMFFIYLTFGLQPMILHSLMAMGSVVYLEAINYIEHYGLQRKQLSNGEYEKVTIMHSWNAPHRFTNYFFFKLQRHSDHHENSSKPFQTLLSLEQSPFLPHGYTLMILMSFFPKVWFKVMDPLVEAYSKLAASEKGRIDLEVKEKAITETRVFLVEITLASLGLLIFSFFSMA